MDWTVLGMALIVVAALCWGLHRQRRRVQTLVNQVTVLAGHADAARTPFELLQQAAGINDWVELANGGDNHSGTFDNRDNCRCRHSYTCATNTIQLNGWPNPNPNPIQQSPGMRRRGRKRPGPAPATA